MDYITYLGNSVRDHVSLSNVRQPGSLLVNYCLHILCWDITCAFFALCGTTMISSMIELGL